MRIAIPVTDGVLATHFGHCDEFAVAEVDAERNSVVNLESLTPPAHAPGAFPKWLHEQGVDVVIAGGMGRRAQALFAEQGIEVVVGAPGMKPDDLIQSYLDDSLETGANRCDH